MEDKFCPYDSHQADYTLVQQRSFYPFILDFIYLVKSSSFTRILIILSEYLFRIESSFWGVFGVLTVSGFGLVGSFSFLCSIAYSSNTQIILLEGSLVFKGL